MTVVNGKAQAMNNQVACFFSRGLESFNFLFWSNARLDNGSAVAKVDPQCRQRTAIA
jgi:hypothetical protein